MDAMDKFKRIIRVKQREQCCLSSTATDASGATAVADTTDTIGATVDAKARSKLRLDVLTFLMTIVAAVWVSGFADSGFRPGYSYFGDYISDGSEFDYIVVGAGAAGSAVAARLARAGWRVLLVEAGGDPHLLTKIPSASFTLAGTDIDWYYETIPNNKSCLSSKGGFCRFSRGRVLGGSTNINYMMYTRGNRRDYDFDVPGWTWNDIGPYFLKYERLQDMHRLPESSHSYHNTSGTVPIGFFADSGNPWHDRLIRGFEALNVPYNPDVNAHSQIGVSQVLGFTAGGERVSTAKAYLEKRSVKKKLKIAKNTRCIGIIIDESNVARGVMLARGFNDTLRVYARREVVVSAGAVATPQILMLSGIGSKKHLKKLGIAVKSDLPVGEGMSDHVLPVILMQVDHKAKEFTNILSLGIKGLQALQWITNRSGPLASNGLTDVSAFLNTKCYNYTLRRLVNDKPECELPSLQFIHAFIDKGVTRLGRDIIERSIPHEDYIVNQVHAANDESALILVNPVVLQPESRGWIRLSSTDPFVAPAIYPNYLEDERDVEEMVRAIEILEHVVETPLYKRHNVSILRLSIPGCPRAGKYGYWACYARHVTNSVQHAVGTAALGPVLDPGLRVRGIKNLRVADASVLPRLPRGNTAAAVIAIGERLADLLLQDQRLR